MRVVIDTNALLACFRKQGEYRAIWDALLDEKFELAVSSEILLEYEEIFIRRITPAIASRLMLILQDQPNLIHTKVFFRWNLITADPDDNKFVDTAISARVRFVVSNDKHFAVLKTIDFPSVEVIMLDEFLEEVRAL